jgi:hypothetical protein
MSMSMSTSTSTSMSTFIPCPLHKSVLIFRFVLFRNADFLFWFVPKRFRNTETNRKIIFFVSRKRPKQIEFPFVSVRTETKDCLFRGHPSVRHIYGKLGEIRGRGATSTQQWEGIDPRGPPRREGEGAAAQGAGTHTASH